MRRWLPTLMPRIKGLNVLLSDACDVPLAQGGLYVTVDPAHVGSDRAGFLAARSVLHLCNVLITKLRKRDRIAKRLARRCWILSKIARSEHTLRFPTRLMRRPDPKPSDLVPTL